MTAQDARQLSLRFEQAQRELQFLDRHLAALEQALDDLQTAKATLEGLQGSAQDALLPIGGGVRIRASVDPSAMVFIDLGAGYSTEASVEEARSRIADQVRSTESTFRTTSAEAEAVARTAQALAQQLSSLPQ